ncbi:tRNA pseudouridine(38-40) synthase TruA [Corynebacterium sp. B5-R-101]|uniref:tRNA pseudouridine synthase A n=1 Tax=Corynebacterium intestinale TaxID=2943492 RepID=A0ABT0TBL9_9CORY|nr:tRNA pseudouridine(38-40) synthase TruA [Corynebacterium intestinale]MCL8494477.1 tRNA pseudouridine(38-40) synthase TruA [Corynebacterium intestinale]MCP1390713.1 tRNA pseudouridine(38-40) synthase TruA [Corynebacterium intestinale]
MTNVRLRLDLAYDGTDFHGWARQKGDLRTVQGVLEDNLSMILRHDVELTVAGRTDAGVHASGQVAHLDTTWAALGQRSIDGDPTKLVKRLAKLLPADVRVHACTEVPADFDARFSALRRRYVYRITTHPRGALPTRARDTATWFKPVDLELMQAAADQLVGLNDFVAFCKAKPHATTIRELLAFEWKDVSTPAEPQLYEAHVTADAFCWSMVRSLVGCCLRVGEGSRGVDFAAHMLREESRSSEIPLADAQGLSLVGVDYPDADQLAARAEMTRGRRAAEDTELG